MICEYVIDGSMSRIHTLTSLAAHTMASQRVHSIFTMFTSMWLTQGSSKPEAMIIRIVSSHILKPRYDAGKAFSYMSDSVAEAAMRRALD